jgi:hypothetical protein
VNSAPRRVVALLFALLALGSAAVLAFSTMAVVSGPLPTPTPVPAPSGEWQVLLPTPSALRPSAAPSGSAIATLAPPVRVATRIVVSDLGIDLPVVSQSGGPNAFPLCNVALRLPGMEEIGGARPAYLYAHARKGMFLPLLTASLKNNGSAMVGLTVYVYTSDDRQYEYTISRVYRHSHSLAVAANDAAPDLWLQTSETAYDSGSKLLIKATPVSWAQASPDVAQPSPRPVVCR